MKRILGLLLILVLAMTGCRTSGKFTLLKSDSRNRDQLEGYSALLKVGEEYEQRLLELEEKVNVLEFRMDNPGETNIPVFLASEPRGFDPVIIDKILGGLGILKDNYLGIGELEWDIEIFPNDKTSAPKMRNIRTRREMVR